MSYIHPKLIYIKKKTCDGKKDETVDVRKSMMTVEVKGWGEQSALTR